MGEPGKTNWQEKLDAEINTLTQRHNQKLTGESHQPSHLHDDMNVQLVRALVTHFGYRPPLPVLVKIYVQIGLAALVADQLDDLDLAGPISHVGLGFLTAIPGSKLVVNSAIDGTTNALLTLRVGYVTQGCLLNAGRTLTRTELRQTANQEVRKELLRCKLITSF